MRCAATINPDKGIILQYLTTINPDKSIILSHRSSNHCNPISWWYESWRTVHPLFQNNEEYFSKNFIGCLYIDIIVEVLISSVFQRSCAISMFVVSHYVIVAASCDTRCTPLMKLSRITLYATVCNLLAAECNKKSVPCIT